jgi:hypothetical protein
VNSKDLKRVTKEFNRYRFPECKAQTLENNSKFLKIRFVGTKANFACCFDENFYDFQYYLKDVANLDAKIQDVIRDGASFIVYYMINQK